MVETKGKPVSARSGRVETKTVEVPAWLHRRLKVAAAEAGIPVLDVCTRALCRGLRIPQPGEGRMPASQLPPTTES